MVYHLESLSLWSLIMEVTGNLYKPDPEQSALILTVSKTEKSKQANKQKASSTAPLPQLPANPTPPSNCPS